MDKLFKILTTLLPLVETFAPGVGAIPEIAAAVTHLIAYIKEQSGLTTDQILARAGSTLDDNEKMLLEDRIRLGA